MPTRSSSGSSSSTSSSSSSSSSSTSPSPRPSKAQQALAMLEFGRVLSKETHYSVVWKAVFGPHRKPCVVKMVVLRSGVHYDQESRKYVVGKGCRGGQEIRVPRHPKDAFARDDPVPFRHTQFARRKSMTTSDFWREVKSFRTLAGRSLAPKVWAAFASRAPNTPSPVWYGFMVVELGDCTLKDVILRRELKRGELDAAKNLIARLHGAGFVHGDCKPSNMVVWWGDDGKATDMVGALGFIDCMKVRALSELGKARFERRKQADWATFRQHIRKNTKERKS